MCFGAFLEVGARVCVNAVERAVIRLMILVDGRRVEVWYHGTGRLEYILILGTCRNGVVVCKEAAKLEGLNLLLTVEPTSSKRTEYRI